MVHLLCNRKGRSKDVESPEGVEAPCVHIPCRHPHASHLPVPPGMAHPGDWLQGCTRSRRASRQCGDTEGALDEGAAWCPVGHHSVLVQLLVHGLQQNLSLLEQMQSLQPFIMLTTLCLTMALAPWFANSTRLNAGRQSVLQPCEAITTWQAWLALPFATTSPSPESTRYVYEQHHQHMFICLPTRQSEVC